jgi:hypothetical protein
MHGNTTADPRCLDKGNPLIVIVSNSGQIVPNNVEKLFTAKIAHHSKLLFEGHDTIFEDVVGSYVDDRMSVDDDVDERMSVEEMRG